MSEPGEGAVESPHTGGPRPLLDTDAVFSPNAVLRIAIDMEPQDWDALRLEHPPQGFGPFGAACHPFNHDFRYGYRPASVSVNGRRLDAVGVRKKAYCGSEDQDKPGLIVDFDRYRPQVLGRDVTRMTLNNAVQDPSYVRQCLGMLVFERAGLPASRCNFALVRVNDGPERLYVHLEAIRKPYLRRNFGRDDGNLYEGTLSDFHADWLPQFEFKEGPDEPFADLVRATKALHGDEGPLLLRLAPHFDLESLFAYWATEVTMAAWDGYYSNQNNYFLYNDPNSGTLKFVPWGLDHVLSNLGSPAARAESWLGHLLYREDAAQAEYYRALDDVLAFAWDETVLLAELDRWSDLLLPLVDEDTADDLEDALDHTRAFIDGRRADIMVQLADGPLAVEPSPPTVPVLVELGSLDVSFDTTWDTLEADPVSVGQAAVTGELTEFDLAVVQAGAIAGATGQTGRVAVGVTLQSGDDLQLFAVGPAADLSTGAVLEPNYTGRWRGGLSRRSSNGSFRLVARLIDGELVLDECDTADPHGVVRGRLRGRVARVE